MQLSVHPSGLPETKCYSTAEWLYILSVDAYTEGTASASISPLPPPYKCGTYMMFFK